MNNQTALIDHQNLIIYDNHSKQIKRYIPLENIVRLESDLYRHDLIPDQQLPCVNLIYQLRTTSRLNQIERFNFKITYKKRKIDCKRKFLGFLHWHLKTLKNALLHEN